VNPAVVICTTWMGGALLRRKRECCHPREAAERLGISVDEVLDLISAGELSALTFMDDDRWVIDLDDLDRVARKARRQDARPDGRLRRRAGFNRRPADSRAARPMPSQHPSLCPARRL
jgi:excisionase family DNA binding protein